MRLMQENEKEQEAQDDDDDGEMVTSKTLAALGILNTLGTLILSVETKPELLRALEDSIQPILVFVLENAVYGTLPSKYG
jgi:importin-7